ncbi:MAG: proton-conducting transporter membrane subunit, partial [Candidatus Margulisiibacteriota bacterium]
TDAPLPFMALFPAALEKLIGIYFLTRLALEMFKLSPASWVSFLMMAIGAITILLAVMMALVQKDYKKLLSYHAISQVGYMILGIGTALPIGIIGGLFHMFNNALYKSCLFLTGGAVEKETGTSDITQLGGLLRAMPITAACFMVAAASISGVPPFNGFFSKELLYDGALERGFVFYLAAVTGSFFTAASFLKLGHAVYFGKTQKQGKEAPWPMLLPMLVLAAICILFGVCNYIPIDLIKPIFKAKVHVPGLNWMLTSITLLVLLGAVANHIFGVKRAGKASGASDHIHYAPGLSYVYDKAERRWFDPYVIGMWLTGILCVILKVIDRMIDWFYEVFITRLTAACSWLLRRAHNGDFSFYIVWSLVGAAVVLLVLLR